MLVGGVALAQQGLIAEPWRKAPAPAAAPVPALRAMPASGLGPVKAPPSLRRKAEAAPASSPAESASKWSPPVVELLVDPWAKGQAAAPARSRWVPSNVEIVDPWADEAPSEPRVASHQSGPPRSTIF
jgi:hypothetical protein